MGKPPLPEMHDFSTKEVKQLLHNKFVVILGDSIQRTIYKDLICFLQGEGLLDSEELKATGERENIWNDHRVEWNGLHNNLDYREVRQYRTDHHLVRFYFLTRVYSDYVASILQDFRVGLTPDILILNSCLWDLNRNDHFCNEPPLRKAFREYRENLQTTFGNLHDILPPSCLIIWNTAMPVAAKDKVKGAYVKRKTKNLTHPTDILEANFESATLAHCWQFDVLDLNFCFRFCEAHRDTDGTHWDEWVHRHITKLLLTHVAEAWGVTLKKKRPQNGIAWNENVPRPQPLLPLPPHPPVPQPTYVNGLPFAQFHPRNDSNLQHNSSPSYGHSSRFLTFEDAWELPAHAEEMQYGGFHGPVDSEEQGFPPPHPIAQQPGGEWGAPIPPYMDHGPHRWEGDFPPPPPRSPRGFRGRHRNGRIMRHQRSYVEHYWPYTHPPNGPRGPPPFQRPPYVGWRGW